VTSTEYTTKVLHGASVQRYADGGTLPQIAQVSAFAYGSAEDLEKVFHHRAPGFAYSRLANPTADAFERRVNELEGGVGAVSFSSGMAAITAGLLNILQAGDELIAGASLFGGTLELLDSFRTLGITVHLVDHVDTAHVAPLLNDKTRAVFGELIGNPGLDIMDLEGMSQLVHSKGVPLIVDATTATPYLIRPLEQGADIVIHASTKYMNGNGSAISGVVIDGGKFPWDFTKYPGLAKYKALGSFAYTARLRNDTAKVLGGCLAPANAFLNLLGLETLELRMDRICTNAQALAESLTAAGISVNYPGLADHPYHALAEKQLGGKAGGIVTLRLGSKERAYAFMNSLHCVRIATSIGDTRTLVIHPGATIYAESSQEEKERAGVYDDTVRVSVGIENTADLVNDFLAAAQALEKGD
jgi:O-acetylhomoserine (thiol)-lyase